MWTKVEINDIELLPRWVNVIRQMNRNYSALDVPRVRTWMYDDEGETWYYAGAGYELALRFAYIPKRDRYQMANVGLIGAIEPADALDTIIDKALDFMQRKNIDSLFAIKPKQMSNPKIEAFHQLVPQNPRLTVTVAHDAPSLIMWDFRPRDPFAQGVAPAGAVAS